MTFSSPLYYAMSPPRAHIYRFDDAAFFRFHYRRLMPLDYSPRYYAAEVSALRDIRASAAVYGRARALLSRARAR